MDLALEQWGLDGTDGDKVLFWAPDPPLRSLVGMSLNGPNVFSMMTDVSPAQVTFARSNAPVTILALAPTAVATRDLARRLVTLGIHTGPATCALMPGLGVSLGIMRVSFPC